MMCTLCVGALVLAMGGHAHADAETARFEQDRFGIGLWVDPPMDDQADARYKEIAEANFTFVIGGFGAHTPEQVARQLELCGKYGLKAVVRVQGYAEDQLPDSPACWGYTIKDEPSAADFPDIAAKVRAIREARPGKLGYINLFPSYASEDQLGTPSYEAHVEQYVETVDPDVLSMDHYPRFGPKIDGRDNYCNDLGVMREYALRKNVPFWNFFNIMPFGLNTDPTEAQLRWQIFTSIAYGAKGVMYFCYYTPAGGQFPKGGAIIRCDGSRTEHYYQARRINEQVKHLGPTLMALTSTGVYRVAPGDDPAKVLHDTPITALERAAYDPEFDLLVGVFRHKDGRRAVMLNNYMFAYCQWPTVTFDVPASEVLEVDPWSGKAVNVRDDSPAMDGLQLSLNAGSGRLFLLP